MKRFLLTLFTVLLIASAIWSYCFVRDRNLARNFKRISSGMTEEQVAKTMGGPSAIEACGSLGGSPNGCVREYRYNTPYPVPYAWVVFIDSTGRVIDKDWYASW
jgi:hypothetical protein